MSNNFDSTLTLLGELLLKNSTIDMENVGSEQNQFCSAFILQILEHIFDQSVKEVSL